MPTLLLLILYMGSNLKEVSAQSCEDGDSFYQTAGGKNCDMTCQIITVPSQCEEVLTIIGDYGYSSPNTASDKPSGYHKRQNGDNGQINSNMDVQESDIQSNYKAICSCSCCYNVELPIVTEISYVRGEAGSSCQSPLIVIETVEECMEAAEADGSEFQNNNDDVDNRPAGCFWDQNGKVYPNANLDPQDLGWSGVGGMCRQETYTITDQNTQNPYNVKAETEFQPLRTTNTVTVVDENECYEYCTALGHGCSEISDNLVSKNQYLSCPQACMMRIRGTNLETCETECEVRECSRTIGDYSYSHCGNCALNIAIANSSQCIDGCRVETDVLQCVNVQLYYSNLEDFMITEPDADSSEVLTIYPTKISHFEGSPYTLEATFSDPYERFSEVQGLTAQIDLEIDCSTLVFAPIEDITLTINQVTTFDLTLFFEYDMDERSFSEHCGYATLTSLILPTFCWQEENAAVDTETVTCLPQTYNDYIGDGDQNSFIEITRTSQTYSFAQDTTLTLTVEVDCEQISWETPTDPNTAFTIGLTGTFEIDNGTQANSGGQRWDMCGVANLSFSGLQEWMNVVENQLYLTPPFLISALGDYTFSVTKTDLNGEIDSITTELTLTVGMLCDELPFQEVRTEFVGETYLQFQYSVPNEHIADTSGIPVTPYCQRASINLVDAPEFCELESSGVENFLNCFATTNVDVGVHEFTIVQSKGELITETKASLTIIEGQYVEELEFTVSKNKKPNWDIEDPNFNLDKKDSASLNWIFSPIQYVEDADQEDEITVIVELGTAESIFLYDGEFITIKQKSLKEFNLALDQFFPENLANFTMNASDGRATVTQALYFDFSSQQEPVDDFVFLPPVQREEKEVNDLPQHIQSQIPKVKISQMSSNGQLTISFTVPMDFPDNFQDLVNNSKRRLQATQNQSIISVEVLSGQEDQSQDVPFDWHLTVLSKMKLELQITFENALEISTGEEADKLVIKFIDKSFFTSSRTNIELEVQEITQVIPPQMILNDAVFATVASTAESLKNVSLTSGSLSAGMGFFLTASLSLLFGFLNMVQMYVHLPLLKLNIPGNLLSILQMFLDIAQLDIIGTEDLFANVFNYEPQEGMEPFNDRFLLLKYETHSVIYNLGDVSLIQFWIFFKLIFYATYRALATKQCCKFQIKHQQFFKRKQKQEREEIKYNWPARFFLEAYLEYCIVAFVKLKRMQYSFVSGSDSIDAILSFFYLTFCIIAPFFYVIYFMIHEQSLKSNKKFRKQYETLFEGMKDNSLLNIWYGGFFMLRRFVFVAFIVFWSEQHAFQIQLAVYIQIVFILYLIQNKPQDDGRNHMLELFSEFSILLFCYSCFAYGPFVHDPMTRYTIGFVSIGIFLTSIGVNMLLNVIDLLKDIKREFLKHKERMRTWFVLKGCKCCLKVKKHKKRRQPPKFIAADVMVEFDIYAMIKNELIEEVPYSELSLIFGILQKVPSIEKVEFFAMHQVQIEDLQLPQKETQDDDDQAEEIKVQELQYIFEEPRTVVKRRYRFPENHKSENLFILNEALCESTTRQNNLNHFDQDWPKHDKDIYDQSWPTETFEAKPSNFGKNIAQNLANKFDKQNQKLKATPILKRPKFVPLKQERKQGQLFRKPKQSMGTNFAALEKKQYKLAQNQAEEQNYIMAQMQKRLKLLESKHKAQARLWN